MVILIPIILLLISFMLALISMKDLTVPKEIQRMLEYRKIRGTIVFLKDKTTHYKSH